MEKIEVKKLLAHMFIKNGKAVRSFQDDHLFEDGKIVHQAREYEYKGADALILFDLSDTKKEQKLHRAIIRDIRNKIQIPIIAGGNIRDIEDIKNLLDAGCNQVILNMSKKANRELLEEASSLFSKEKIVACINDFTSIAKESDLIQKYADQVLLMGDNLHLYDAVRNMPLLCTPLMEMMDFNKVCTLLKEENVTGISGTVVSNSDVDLFSLKEKFQEQGIKMQQMESSMNWSEFKLNSEGMIPVIVQDYKNNEVLMLAYMNEEAFNLTIKTGRMTYWSRSRNEIWVKGDTSGHYQYVKQLSIDCDNDTLLAKVDQIGAACHTGNRSCFYRDLLKRDYHVTNTMATLKRMYKNASKRKKTIDPDTAKTEIVNVLYHVTDFMAEYNISWDAVSEELDKRELSNNIE